MMKGWKVVVLVLGLLLAVNLAGCHDGTQEHGDTVDYGGYTSMSHSVRWYSEEQYNGAIGALREQGLLGEHELQKFKFGSRATGRIDGDFYFGSGWVRGKMSEDESIRFTWRCRNVGVISTVPVNKILVVTDDTKARPTIQFKFDLGQIIENSVGKGNPNDYLDPDLLRCVTIRINRKQQEKEPSLPDVR